MSGRLSRKVCVITGIGGNVGCAAALAFARGDESVRRIGSTLIAATLDVHMAAAEAPVFDLVAAEDVLLKVLTGYGLLPGVVRT